MENLKITPESKRGLEWLKETYGFRTYSIGIDAVVQFFKHNKINPRDSLSENYSQTLFDFKKEILFEFKTLFERGNLNTERVIKLNRRIEEDFIKPINKKIIDIHKVTLDSYNEKSNNDLVKNILDEKDNSESDKLKIQELDKLILKQEKLINDYKKIVEEKDKDLKEYHRCLKTLNLNMRIDSGRPYINLSVSDAEDLFYLIPE